MFEQLRITYFFDILLGFLVVLRRHSIFSVFCFVFVTFVCRREKKKGKHEKWTDLVAVLKKNTDPPHSQKTSKQVKTMANAYHNIFGPCSSFADPKSANDSYLQAVAYWLKQSADSVRSRQTQGMPCQY